MYFSFPEFDAPAEKASWIALLLSTIPAILGFWVVICVWRLNPGRCLGDALRERAGRMIGGAINLAFACFFMLSAALSLWELDEVIVTTMLVRTPSLAVSGAMTIIVVMAVRQGIEAIARSAIILAAGGILATSFSTVILLPEVNLNYLLPLFPIVGADLVRSIVYHASLVDFLPVALYFLPYTFVRPQGIRSLMATPIISHTVIALAMALTIGVLSFPVANHENFEYLSLVRQASLGTFLERLDPLVLTGWTVLGYLRVSAFFLASLIATSSLLGLRDYRSLSVPMGIILLCLSLIVLDTYRARKSYMTGGGLPFNLFFLYVLPLLVWLILRASKRGEASPPPDEERRESEALARP